MDGNRGTFIHVPRPIGSWSNPFAVTCDIRRSILFHRSDSGRTLPPLSHTDDFHDVHSILCHSPQRCLCCKRTCTDISDNIRATVHCRSRPFFGRCNDKQENKECLTAVKARNINEVQSRLFLHRRTARVHRGNASRKAMY